MLHDKLKNMDRLPFHMPGHKRNEKFNIIGSNIDITEIDGFDNLHNPDGVIKELEGELAGNYKTERSFLSVNGSTAGILAAIHSVCKKGSKIIIARNCHKSVYNACLLLELKIIFIEPEYDQAHGFYKRLSQETVNLATAANPDAAAIVITSPTYEGYISNITANIPLIIDAAHGAHLGLGGFPEYPRADIVISSLHKTLPALTQTAVVNVYNKAYVNNVKLYMDIFETSSPSYVLMNSVSICCEYIRNNTKDFVAFRAAAEAFHETELNRLQILDTDDKSKIVVSTAKMDLSGTELADKLRNEFNIEPEAASLNYVILMTSVGDTKESMEALKNALTAIDGECESAENGLDIIKPPCPDGLVNLCYNDNCAKTALTDSIGKTAGEFVYAYPPDIPIISPNEIITREAIDYVNEAIKRGVNLISDSNLLPNYILTKEDK